MASPVLLIDVAHPPRPPGEVETLLADALALARNTPEIRIIKVIHGYGSSGRGGTTRELVRNWAYRRRAQLRMMIPGEEFSRFNEQTLRMRAETGQVPDADLDAGNRGVTLLWFR